MTQVVSEPLATERLENGKRRLLRELLVQLNDGSILRIPKGFVTDYSSIPWWGRFLVRWSKVDVAGVVHDYLYKVGGVSRSIADAIWYEVATAGQHAATKIQAQLAWIALRLGGWWRWGKYRKNS